MLIKHVLITDLCSTWQPRLVNVAGHPSKIFNTACTTSYNLNSGVTYTDTTKFQNVNLRAEIKIVILQPISVKISPVVAEIFGQIC